MNESKTPKYRLRAKEICIQYRIARSTLWLYRKQGKITSKKLSARVTLFDTDEFEALLNKNSDNQ